MGNCDVFFYRFFCNFALQTPNLLPLLLSGIVKPNTPIVIGWGCVHASRPARGQRPAADDAPPSIVECWRVTQFRTDLPADVHAQGLMWRRVTHRHTHPPTSSHGSVVKATVMHATRNGVSLM